jgi:GNAT superfamily N-acetyltransferase
MEPIRELEALSRLIATQMTRGVATNTFLSPETYRQEIQAGTLMHHAWPGGLLLLRMRPGFQVLNYFLQQMHTPLQPEPVLDIPPQTVLEVPVRPGKQVDADKVLAFWQTHGFTPFLKRVRLVRMPQAPQVPDMVVSSHQEAVQAKHDATGRTESNPIDAACTDFRILSATQSDLSPIQDLLNTSFDRRTGCLPSQGALESAIEEGHVLQAWGEDGRLGGVVHFKCTPAVMEIRHLAVHPDCRGRGLAKQLVMKALEGREAVRAQVWTGADNEAACAVYAACGYAPDGWTSEVWMKP